MTEIEIKNKILELFQKERQKPNANFDESHLLDYLTFPAHSKNTIKNSFKGVRRYYRFMDKLELEFGICFTLSDLDKYYSVNALTKKVKERIDKKQGNLILLKERNKEKNKYIFELALILILIAVYMWLGIHIIPIILTPVFGLAIYWTLNKKNYNIQHNKQLTLRILENK